jgi:hypothetical protein
MNILLAISIHGFRNEETTSLNLPGSKGKTIQSRKHYQFCSKGWQGINMKLLLENIKAVSVIFKMILTLRSQDANFVS